MDAVPAVATAYTEFTSMLAKLERVERISAAAAASLRQAADAQLFAEDDQVAARAEAEIVLSSLRSHSRLNASEIQGLADALEQVQPLQP
jgi:hypothetical protein